MHVWICNYVGLQFFWHFNKTFVCIITPIYLSGSTSGITVVELIINGPKLGKGRKWYFSFIYINGTLICNNFFISSKFGSTVRSNENHEKITASSAKLMVGSFVFNWNKLFISTMNRREPNTVPCGTITSYFIQTSCSDQFVSFLWECRHFL